MARQDPLGNFRFRVEIDGIQTAGFSEVAIGATTTDVVEYREGSDRGAIRKLAGLTKHGNVTLKRGLTLSLDLYNWHRQIVTGAVANNRRNLVIVLQDESGTDQVRFLVRDAWPVKYEVGNLNATGNEVFIELLELVNEGVERDS
ncbi:MAG: phage tail protein [Povalibacter sp.]|jgi:phage tail-like protein